MSWLVTLLAASALGQSASATQSNQCLLVGPSKSLLFVVFEEAKSGSDGFVLRKLAGQPWPFSVEEIHATGKPAGYFDEATKLAVEVTQGYGDEETLNVGVFRGSSSAAGIPLLSGSCAKAGGAIRAKYPASIMKEAAKPSHTAEMLRSTPIGAAKECQVVSADGWVSRFTIDYHDDGVGMTIRPSDQHLWTTAAVESRRLPLPKPFRESWLKFAFGLTADGSKTPGNRGINSIWVYATPSSDQSSASASFFGHTNSRGHKEDVRGICAEFKSGEKA